MNEESTLVFFDYEGTLGTSIRRHYVQYVEALARIRKYCGAALPQLEPLSEAEFLERYPAAKKVGKLLAIEGEPTATALAQGWLDRLHSEIIWEYNPEHMLYEQLIGGSVELLRTISPVCSCAMISFTRQREDDFRDHLTRLGLIGDGLLQRERVHTVGGDGKSSREAKHSSIVAHYGERIAAQRRAGKTPVMVADAVDDMAAAFDAGLGFVGVCSTGKSSEAEFRKALAAAGQTPGPVEFFSSVGDPACIEFLRSLAGRG